jgi:hypothetical protein
MMRQRKTNPRADHRRREIQRANRSVSLAEKFPVLKSWRIVPAGFDPARLTRNGKVSNTVHFRPANPVFLLVGPAPDFDWITN